MSDRESLLADLHADAERIPALIAALDETTLSSGAYEQGWTVRDVVAHLAAIEWTYPRLLELAAAGPDASPAGGADAAPDMDGYNARQVAKRRDLPVTELLDEFRRNRAATIEALADADAALLQRPIRSYGGSEGSLLEVLRSVAVDHVRQHLADIAAGS